MWFAKGWELHQMDVNSAFLHGDLEEEVFMKMALGFASSSPNKVCHLKKSLYGLRQAPRQWFTKLSSKLCRYGFVRSYVDYSLFVYRKGDIFMALLVDADELFLLAIAPKNLKSSKTMSMHVSISRIYDP